jgi:Protein of unknown function (DUF2867)
MKIHRSTRVSTVVLDADAVWRVVAGGGPGRHWYVDALPFVVRGGLDRALGGHGRRWPVPEADLLEAGHRAGFWRVTQAGRRTLSLVAEVRAPGQVLLETRVAPERAGGCTVRQSVTFDPVGLAGQLYMLADIPAREVVLELTHRALLAEISAAS